MSSRFLTLPPLMHRASAVILLLSFVAGGAVAAQASIPAARHLAPLVSFPADQSAHASSANEWWYIVGHVHSGGHTFGYETTIFKFARFRPPGFTVPVTLYRTDVAITDESAGKFQQHVTYYFPQSAALAPRGLNIRVGSDALRGNSPASMDLRSSMPGGFIRMHLSSIRSPMYVGGRGYIPLGDGHSYYYSLTDLASHGVIRVAGRTYTVTGVSWLDHQWGNWAWTSIKGWTWMALQLSNGVQLSVFDFRGTNTRVRAASVLAANGALRTVRDISIGSTGSWHSPHTGGTYPSGWVVGIPAVKTVLHVSPTVKDQELAVPSQSAGSYWEGSGRIVGTWEGKRVTGLSYTELTGYAGRNGAP